MQVDRYDEPVKELEIPYSGNKGRQFIEEEDRWLILAVNRLGYGRWEELKAEVRRSPEFRFNWFIKSRTAVELKRRLDILVRVIEKENEVKFFSHYSRQPLSFRFTEELLHVPCAFTMWLSGDYCSGEGCSAKKAETEFEFDTGEEGRG